MPSALEQRLSFANGLLYDADRWLDAIIQDVPPLAQKLGEAQRHIYQAQAALEAAKADARLKDFVVAMAAVAAAGEEDSEP